MRKVSLFFAISCWLLTCSFGTAQTVTKSNNSPIVQTAKNFHASYGVRADVIYAILKAFEKEEPNGKKRLQLTENLIKQYSQVPERAQKNSVLSESSKIQLGIQNKPALTEALNWDLFATPRFLSSYGDNSPIINAGGDVYIWYGIPSAAVRALSRRLEADKTALTDYGKRLEDLTKKWGELNKSLINREDEMAKEAKKLLDEGKIEEAVLVLKDRRYALSKITDRSKKREAEAAFDYAKGLVLELKYDSAAIQYKDALDLDPTNSDYLAGCAFNELTRAHYDEAILYLEKALNIDSTILGKHHPKIATGFGNLGSAWKSKGEYDRAIIYYEKALGIDTIALGKNHQDVAILFHNLGGVWELQGEYDRAIMHYEKALEIDTITLDMNHPYTATYFNSLGIAWYFKGEYDRAIMYYEKALGIDTIALGKNHPYVATYFNSLGAAWNSKGDYDRTIVFYEKALSITTLALGNTHPDVATCFNNIGVTLSNKGKYDLAINYIEKALNIDTIVLGNNHPNTARDFSNLGVTWSSKREYDRAIVFYEKALNSVFFALGKSHPNVAILFNNLGNAWYYKREFNKAIEYFEKALGIDTIALGKNHPNVANGFENLGSAWYSKGEFDSAILFFEKAIVIFREKLEVNHTKTETCAKKLSLVANARGMEYIREMKYAEALPYFQKALKNAKAVNDFSFSLTCLNNIGSSFKFLKHYKEGLSILDEGIRSSEEIANAENRELKSPEVQAKIAEMRNTVGMLRIRMRYHKIGCLFGLGYKKEAEDLAKQVQAEAEAIKDQRTLEDLKRDGWIK